MYAFWIVGRQAAYFQQTEAINIASHKMSAARVLKARKGSSKPGFS
jgi:hypothetical protein